jgi:hypothetical protein
MRVFGIGECVKIKKRAENFDKYRNVENLNKTKFITQN